MKNLVKKIIDGKEAYYFELFIRTPEGRKGVSRYLGATLPAKEEMAARIFDYYQDFAKLVIENTDKKVGEYFKYTGIDAIEEHRMYYQALNHELNRERLEHFKSIFMILFILNSARAEGSRMTQNDLARSFTHNKPKTYEQREAMNTIKAVNWAFSNEFTWTISSIKKLHAILFHDLEPAFAGKYKPYDNVVGNQLYGHITSTTSFDKVPDEMKKWIFEVNQLRRIIYPPLFALETHLRFETIHPFHDGNGRIGRILLNRLLIEKGFMPVIFFEENHEAYCNSIALAREGRKDKYIKLFVKQLKKTRDVFEEKEESREFVSERKGMAVSWEYSRERQVFKFTNLKGKYKS